MPERIAALLEACAAVLVRSANAQFEAGADAIQIGEGGAGAKMLSPAMYEQWLLPVHRRLIAQIDGPTIMHICGDIRPRLHLMSQTGMTCFNFDWCIPPVEMVTAAAGRFTVMGNVNTTDLLTGQPAEIRRQVAACVAAGVEIISPGLRDQSEMPQRQPPRDGRGDRPGSGVLRALPRLNGLPSLTRWVDALPLFSPRPEKSSRSDYVPPFTGPKDYGICLH